MKTLPAIITGGLLLSIAFAQDDQMRERRFEVRPDFLFLSPGAEIATSADSDDPFADDSPPKRREEGTAQEILEAAGVTFPSGASARFTRATNQLTVVNTGANLDLVDAFVSTAFNDVPKVIHVLLENITLPHGKAVTLVHEHMGEGDASALRRELQRMIRAGDAKITASQMIPTSSGQRARSESITEQTYPVEFDPGEIPRVVTGELNGNPNFIVGIRATAFATRNTGVTLEVDPVLGSDGRTIDLNIAPEVVDLHDTISYGSGRSRLVQPVFYTQSISTAVTISNGNCMLLAMTTPAPSSKNVPNYENDERTLVFVRPAVQKRTLPRLEDIESADARQMGFLLEFIEMDRNDAAELSRMETDFLNDSPMRKQALRLIAKGKATRMESSYLATRSGQRAKVESVREIIYPTESSPPQVPEEARADANTAKLIIPVTFTEFETRNAGTTLELDPLLWANGNAIDIKLAPEIVERIGWDSYGKQESKIEQPVFTSMTTSTSTRLIDRQPVLLAIHVPVDRKTRKPNGARRVLVFITGSILKANP